MVVGFIIVLGLIAFTVWLIHGIIQLWNMPIPKSAYESEISKCESPIERRVFRGLLNNGLYPTPQYRVGKYWIDLAFPHQLVAVECDGKKYHSSAKQKAHDRKRDKYMRERGWTVLRFSGSKIHRNLPEVIRSIKEEVEKTKKAPTKP
ncbi:hypothetical protein X953_10190 [Virgibacillus sp. SK37]|nr:hypothetical protein X953_10190 [Virgibacillus sp. SK37]